MSATKQASAWEPESPAPNVVRVFGDFRFHSDGDLLALAFAPDGSLWSVEEPGTLRRWDPATGQQREWQFLSDLETLWVFSPDTRVLASASDDLSLWDVSSGNLLTAVPQPGWVTALAFRADPTFLATGHDDGIVRVWDAAGHLLVREFKGATRPISALGFSPDGGQLAAASEDKVVYVWDVATGKLLGRLVGHTDRIQALAWHPQGHCLVTAGWDTTARVWNATTFEPVILLNSHATQITALAFSRGGEWLACADSQDAVHVWDFAASKVSQVLKGHKDQINCLAFSHEGVLLASGGVDRVIRLWDLRQAQAAAPRDLADRAPDLDGLHRSWTSLALDRGGEQLASTCGGAALHVWRLGDGAPALRVEGEGILQSLAYSPDDRWLAAGGADARVLLWEKASGHLVRTLGDPDLKDPVTALAFAPDAGLLASASATGTAVWVWGLPDGGPVLLIPDALDGCAVEALAFHPRGRVLAVGGIDWLATSGSDGAIALWDLDQRCELTMFDGGTTCLAFAPDGDRLASASLTNSVCLWDVPARRLVAELTGHEDTVTCVAFSPDGRWLASGGDDRTVRLWDAADLHQVAQADLDTQVKALTFAPDGRHLFTGNGNTTCYQIDLRRLLSEAGA